MGISVIAPIEDIEVDHGFEADVEAGRSFVPPQLPRFDVGHSVAVASTGQTLDDVESGAASLHDGDHVEIASLDGAHIGDYIMMAAVFAMIVFLWMQ